MMIFDDSLQAFNSFYSDTNLNALLYRSAMETNSSEILKYKQQEDQQEHRYITFIEIWDYY
jgi:hypothetical protein